MSRTIWLMESLATFGMPGDVPALLLDRLDPQAVEPAELAQRVEPGQVLADAGVGVHATGLGQADEQAGPAAHGAERAAGLLRSSSGPPGRRLRRDQVADAPRTACP